MNIFGNSFNPNCLLFGQTRPLLWQQFPFSRAYREYHGKGLVSNYVKYVGSKKPWFQFLVLISMSQKYVLRIKNGLKVFIQSTKDSHLKTPLFFFLFIGSDPAPWWQIRTKTWKFYPWKNDKEEKYLCF